MQPTRYNAPAVLRAVRVLEHLARCDEAPSLSDLSRSLDVSKSTLHGLLGVLQEVHWVQKDGPRGGYRLGPGVLALSRRQIDVRELCEASRPFVQRLAETLDESVFLGTREGDAVVIHEIFEGRKEMRVTSQPGVRLPLLAAATGKVVLADLDPGEARRYLEEHPLPRFTERSLTDTGAFWAEVENARARGFGTDDQEYLQGVCAVAVPVRRAGRLVALLWTTGFVSSLPAGAVEKTARELLRTAERIAGELELRSGRG